MNLNLKKIHIGKRKSIEASRFILLLSMMLFSCAKKLEIEVTAIIDGNPAAEIKVLVDDIEEGVTDNIGHFSKVIKKKPGREDRLSLTKEAPGYRIEPWQESFVMKIPPKDGMEKYSFQVNFKATKYITLAVTEKDESLVGASVTIGSKKARLSLQRQSTFRKNGKALSF